MRRLPEYAFSSSGNVRQAQSVSGKFEPTSGMDCMKNHFRAPAVLIALPLSMGVFFTMQSPAQSDLEIGGQKIVTLKRTVANNTRPEFTSVTIAPGRGMELLQVTANFPGKGNLNVLAGPDLAGAKQMLDEKDTPNGDLGYRLGAAFLVPYPNR